ncbi:MAG: hypothetical protein K2X41_12920 [Hyphomicrobium sp.]|nr:hypothetical protein [Hyphomicrobium sp.]
MLVHAVINEKAGTALASDLASVTALIEKPFQQYGHDIVVEIVAPDQLTSTIERAAKTPADVIVIGGGDGTVRAGARIAMLNRKGLGIIPLGTLNRLARDLKIPLDIANASDALARGSLETIDVASVNDEIYLCNSLLGLPPEYSAMRQSMRGKPFVERMQGYVKVISGILSSRNRLHITIDDGREQTPLRVLSLAVANNAYCENPGIGLTRPALDGGELAIYASRHRSGWGMARALARAIMGRWKGDPHLQQFRAHDVTIRLSRPNVRLSNDGEVAMFATPLRYKIHPKALSILMPGSSS